MNIVTFATRDYQWLVKPFYSLLEKYWPGQHVICFGDQNAYLPSEIEFRPFSGDFKENFGHGVSEALKTLKDDVFILTLADMWLRAEVKNDEVLLLAEYMRARLNHIARIGIGSDPGQQVKGKVVDTVGDLELYRTDIGDKNIGMRSGLLLWPSLWNRELVTGILRDCTLWDFEILHNEKMRTVKGYWVDEMVYPYAHVFFRHNQDRVRSLRHFNAKDRALIESLLPDGIMSED